MTNDFHTISLAVRDYECDVQGIVNNAVYLNYLEHARHEFLRLSGTSFAELHGRGIDPVVVRIEIDYRSSLLPGDTFIVFTRMSRRGRFRFVFEQRIVRDSDGVEVTRANVTGTFLESGRSVPLPIELEGVLDAPGGEA